MKKSIFIDGGANEIRVARQEAGRLEELFIERPEENHCAGNIYKGKVSSIVPGIQAAFVDVGLSKNGFLYVGDCLVSNHSNDLSEQDLEGDDFLISRKRDMKSGENIKELLREGQELLVQVTKDPIGTKRALNCLPPVLIIAYIVVMSPP